MSDDIVGYVVIEYNQASHQPSLAWKSPHLYDDSDDAHEKALALQAETHNVGRRERYAVGTVYIEED